MSILKRSQHYVWKHYLKPWTIDGQINCLRKGKVFRTSLENIAQQSYFYEATLINKNEFSFLVSYINHVHPSAKESLINLLEMHLTNSISNEYNKKCGIENFHENIEHNFIPLLQKIYNHDLSFLENLDDKNKFSYYIASQYFRTSRMRNGFINPKIKFDKKINRETIAKILALFFADSLGNWIFSESRVTLLINKTDMDFITGDQPVLNLKGDPNRKKDAEALELFYPISPILAIYLSENKSENEVIKSTDRILEFNKQVVLHSEEQIFAKDVRSFNIL